MFPLFSSHRQITESTLLLLQPPGATGLRGCSADGFCRVSFFSLAPARTWKTSLASVVLSEKNHRNVGESFKNETFFVMLQSPVQCFIFTICTVLARHLSRSHTEVSEAKSSGIEDTEERYRPLVRNCNRSSRMCTKHVYLTR